MRTLRWWVKCLTLPFPRHHIHQITRCDSPMQQISSPPERNADINIQHLSCNMSNANVLERWQYITWIIEKVWNLSSSQQQFTVDTAAIKTITTITVIITRALPVRIRRESARQHCFCHSNKDKSGHKVFLVVPIRFSLIHSRNFGSSRKPKNLQKCLGKRHPTMTQQWLTDRPRENEREWAPNEEYLKLTPRLSYYKFIV